MIFSFELCFASEKICDPVTPSLRGITKDQEQGRACGTAEGCLIITYLKFVGDNFNFMTGGLRQFVNVLIV